MDLYYIIPIIVVVLVFGTKAFREVKDYLLKKEQIKADAQVRSEALRMKNEIELEKIIQNDRSTSTQQQAAQQQTAQSEDDLSAERKTGDRLRY